MLRLALLLCDTPIPTVKAEHGTYVDIFRSFLDRSLKAYNPPSEIEWTLDGFDVVRGEFPSETQLSNFHGILISGSAASAYAPLEWTPPLFAFLGRVVAEYRDIKVFGICFGQQVIAMALNGTCVPNNLGWEVGTYNVDLSGAGKLIFERDVLRIQEMHRDIVPSLPPLFESLGSSPKCAVQGMALAFDPKVPIKSLDDIHVLCLQGHPEFTPQIVHKLINAREKAGVLSEEVASDARTRADAEHDGVDVIGNALWKILLLPKKASLRDLQEPQNAK